MEKNTSRQRIINWVLFSAFCAWILIMHACINIGFGDDEWFYNVAHDKSFILTDWLKIRYMGWSSRTLIEAALIGVVSLPRWCWRIADAGMIIISMLVIYKMFVNENRERKCGMLFVVCGFFILDYYGLLSAGWQATTVNYLWPMTGMLIGLYPLAKMIKKEKIHVIEYILCTIGIIFAAFSEQAAVVLTIIYVVFLFYFLKNKIHINFYFYIQFFISIAGIINALLCPGNAQRNLIETPRWFPDYANLNFLQKIDIGISSTIKSLFLERNNEFIILLFVIMMLGIWKYKNWIRRMIFIVPFIVVMGLNILRRVVNEESGFLNFITEYGVLFEKSDRHLKIYVWYFFLLLLCLVIIINIFAIASNVKTALLTNFIFLIGLMTKAMLGFSSTVWISYPRTGWYCQVALLCCTIVLLEDWGYRDKKKNIVLIGVFGIFSIICALYNTFNVFCV